MDQLPADLRTPPLPVVALIGCAELHKDIGGFFNANLRPPLFFVSLPEGNESVLTRLFGTPKQHKVFRTPDGILKADWISKQRTRRAAVAVAFVQRSHVEGDPNAWMQMTRGLQSIKAVSAHKGVWLVLVVVQEGPVSDLPQDRITGLWNSFEPKQLLVLSRQAFDASLPADERKALQDAQLRPLQQLIVEGAAAYYTAAGQRLRQKQLDLTTSLGSCPPEVSTAIHFKLAVFAEFRQDWPGAVTFYQAAAAALQGVPLGRPTVSCQRHTEVVAVAEVVHFKAMMLLLHQQRYGDALQQLAMHLAVFGRTPDGLPLAAAAAHYGWLAKQYQLAAQMITSSRMDGATLQAHPEADPCHLLMSASQVALTRKSLAEHLAAVRGGPVPFDTGSVKPSRYLGQYERKQTEGPNSSSDLTDAELCLYLEAEERRINQCQVVLALLLQAQAAHLKDHHQQQQQQQQHKDVQAPSRPVSKAAVDRLSARLAFLIAEQHVETHNLTAARKLLLQVVYTYRRDGWDALLLHSLLVLRDVCQRLKLHQEALLHSLEVACLAYSLRNRPNADSAAAEGLFDREQAQGLASAALLGLLVGPQDSKSSIKKHTQQQQQQQVPEVVSQGDLQGTIATQQGTVSSPRSGSSSGGWQYVVQQVDLWQALQQAPVSQDASPTRTSTVLDVLLLHKQQDFGWWQLVSVAGGFVTHSPDPTQLCICVALCNNLPVDLPLQSAVLTLADAQGTWQQVLQVGPGGPLTKTSDSSSSSSDMHDVPHAIDSLSQGLDRLELDQQQRQQHKWPLLLQPGAWQQLHGVVQPRCIGTVVGEVLELVLSAHARVAFKLQSFPPGRPVLGSSDVRAAHAPFSLQQQVKLGTWAAKIQHVGLMPTMQVLQPDLLLVGEFVPIEVRIHTTAVQPPCTLEITITSAASGTPPPSALTLLAALTDGKLQELSPESQILSVPRLAAGTSWVQRLWARSRQVVSCSLKATLSCPALVTQQTQLSFKSPFEHRVRLSAEAGMHTLVGPSEAFTAVNSSNAAPVVVSQQAAAGALDTAAAAAAAVPLVVGQGLLVQVMVTAVHSADLLLLGAELELEPGSQLKLLNSLSQQLAGAPLAASSGSIHCLLLQLMPTGKVPQPSSIGALKLSWRRKQTAQVVASSSSSTSSGKVAEAAPAAALTGTGAVPGQDVETRLHLPLTVVKDSLMTAKTSGPRSATAGTSFPFALQLHNLTSQPQEVQLSVQEAQGFVFAGSKQQVVNVLPRTTHDVSWTLVAHASGQLQLPVVRVTSSKLGCSVTTQGAPIHVMPY